MQSYTEYIQTKGLNKEAEWYNDVQNWAKENPNLAAGGTAALAAIPLYLLGRGFGKKRDRTFGLITALLGGGAAFYGMKNYGLPWLTSLGQAPVAPKTQPAPSTTNQHLPTTTGMDSRTSSRLESPKKQPPAKPAAKTVNPTESSKRQNAVASKPVNGGGKRTPAYTAGIAQFRQQLESKYGPADKWSPDLMTHYQTQASQFYNDPTYKMRMPGE